VKELGKWIGIGVAVLVLLTLIFIGLAIVFPDVRIISRDIAIVILATFQIIATLMMVVLLIAILYAVKSMNELTQKTIIPRLEATQARVDEVVENTRAITSNVRSSTDNATTTTVFVAEQVASPIIRVSGLVAGVRAAAGALARRDGGHDKSSSL